jgi:hypothetical protein
MKKAFYTILLIAALPFFSAAWLTAAALQLPGRDDMPSPAELIQEYKNQ